MDVVESNQFHVDRMINEVDKVVPLKVPVAAGCTVIWISFLYEPACPAS